MFQVDTWYRQFAASCPSGAAVLVIHFAQKTNCLVHVISGILYVFRAVKKWTYCTHEFTVSNLSLVGLVAVRAIFFHFSIRSNRQFTRATETILLRVIFAAELRPADASIARFSFKGIIFLLCVFIKLSCVDRICRSRIRGRCCTATTSWTKWYFTPRSPALSAWWTGKRAQLE